MVPGKFGGLTSLGEDRNAGRCIHCTSDQNFCQSQIKVLFWRAYGELQWFTKWFLSGPWLLGTDDYVPGLFSPSSKKLFVLKQNFGIKFFNLWHIKVPTHNRQCLNVPCPKVVDQSYWPTTICSRNALKSKAWFSAFLWFAKIIFYSCSMQPMEQASKGLTKYHGYGEKLD